MKRIIILVFLLFFLERAKAQDLRLEECSFDLKELLHKIELSTASSAFNRKEWKLLESANLVFIDSTLNKKHFHIKDSVIAEIENTMCFNRHESTRFPCVHIYLNTYRKEISFTVFVEHRLLQGTIFCHDKELKVSLKDFIHDDF